MGLDQNPVFRTVVNIALNKQKVKKAELLYHTHTLFCCCLEHFVISATYSAMTISYNGDG